MKFKNLIVGLAVTTAFGTTAYAGAGGAEKHNKKMNGTVQVNGETKTEAQARVNEKREVSGTILQMKSVDVRGTDAQNVVALVKTRKADQRLLMDLGPQAELRPLNLRQGSMIAAEGQVARLGDHQVLIASRIKSGDTELKVERKEQMDQAKRATANQQQRSATGTPETMPPGADEVPRAEPAPSPEEQARAQEEELDRALERDREREEARVPTPDLEQDQSMNRPLR